MNTSHARLRRSRWAAIGAAVAVTLGTGGLATTFATSSASSLVAVTPVRVLDTRLAAMGPALTASTPRLLDVAGAIPTVGSDGVTVTTATVVPDGATAIVANVTLVSPTTPGFLAVRPGTATGNPTTSSVNAGAAGVIVPNAVTVELPTAGATTGQIQLWFSGTEPTATAQVLVDIVGYYLAGAAGPVGPAGPAGPVGPAGLAYVGTFQSGATTAIGTTGPPPAPANYVGTFDLTPGRIFVTGDLSVRNEDVSNAGIVICKLYVGDTAVGQAVIEEVAARSTSGGFADLTIANTALIATGGSTNVSFRCYREGSSTGMSYWFTNMTVFAVQ